MRLILSMKNIKAKRTGVVLTFLGAGFIVGGRLLWISGLKDKSIC